MTAVQKKKVRIFGTVHSNASHYLGATAKYFMGIASASSEGWRVQ